MPSTFTLVFIAVLFTAFGIWLAVQLAKPKIQTILIEKEVYVPKPDEFTINDAELKKLDLTNREYEVLQLLAKGLTNADIAQNPFFPLSTIKTHVSNL